MFLLCLPLLTFSIFSFFNSSKQNPSTPTQDPHEEHRFHPTEIDVPNKYEFPILKMIELNKTNHVVLRGEINQMMVSKVMVRMGQIDSDEIILYISSPGGSVSAGNVLIEMMNFLRQKGKTLICVADQAASMAFSIFQACDNRYVTPNSILMQHQMALGVKDQYENLKSYMRLMDAINEDYIKKESARIGMSDEMFRAKILSDWWLYGQQNVEEGVADQLVYVGCDQELFSGEVIETYKHKGRFLDLAFSRCPLSRAPIRVIYPQSEISSDPDPDSDSDQLLSKIANPISSKKDIICDL